MFAWGSNAYEPYAPTAWHRDHRFAVGGILLATTISWVISLLGPSAVALDMGPRNGSLLPPWYGPKLPSMPNEWAVCIASWLLLLIAGGSLLIAFRALGEGWRPRPRRMAAMGGVVTFVTALLPPLTSADVLMYAAYGRLQRIGRDPYVDTPAEVFRSLYDPVVWRTEKPWEDTPSVYGPIASWSQLAANFLGGENMHDIVFWMQAFHVVAFLGVCAITLWIARGDRDRLNRAILMTVLNPLMIWGVVTSAHNEGLSVIFAIGGMMLMRRSGFGAGIGIGLAGCAKLSIGLWGIAMLWAYRREPKKALLLCLGTLIPMGLAYGLWKPAALTSVLRNASYVSAGSWAQPFHGWLDTILHNYELALAITTVVSYTLLVVVAIMLSRLLPWKPVPGLPEGVDPKKDPMTVAFRTALVLSVAWLVSSMYTLSWYDLIAFVPLGVLAASQLDGIMVIRNLFLALAYVPGRVTDISDELDSAASFVRTTISPLVQWAVLAAIIIWFVLHTWPSLAQRLRSRLRRPVPQGADQR